MDSLISHKTFLKTILIVFSIFVCYHTFAWFYLTKKIFEPEHGYIVGDLGRMSYQVDLLHKRKTTLSLKKLHIPINKFTNQAIDVITLGDSFANGAGGGKDPFFQDHIASITNFNILNIPQGLTETPLETVIGLYNNGSLQRIKPKAVIVESVQRIVPQRFAKEINLHYKTNLYLQYQQKLNTDSNNVLLEPMQHPELFFINTANYKIPYYMLKYKYNERAKDDVYRFKLSKKLFSIGTGDETLIYRDDLMVIPSFTNENVQLVNSNFNKVANLLKKINIKLIFMPVADKYTMYSPYISDNTHPQNSFFKLLRNLEKEYYLLDTEKLLLPLLENGIQDLYFCDDTHWTYKACDAIANDPIFRSL